MRIASVILLLCWLATLACAETFSVVQYGDVHAAFGRSRNYRATALYPWLFAHTNDGVLNIKGVVMAGDRYEDAQSSVTNFYNPGDTNGTYSTFQLTNDERTIVSSGLMFFASDGNHDGNNTNNVVGWCRTNVTLPWNVITPPSLFTNQTYFVTNKDAGVYNNLVMKMSYGGIKLKFLSYHSDPDTNSNQAVIYAPQTTWIRQQMRADPDYNCFVVAHYFLGKDTNDVTPTNIVPSYYDHNPVYANIGPGNAPIENGILAEPNLAGFISGHNLRLLKGFYATNGVDGHPVGFVQFNTQSSSDYNLDWVNVFTFDTLANTVTVGTYSISQAAWLRDYDTNYASVYFPNGNQHTATWRLPMQTRAYPIFRR